MIDRELILKEKHAALLDLKHFWSFTIRNINRITNFLLAPFFSNERSSYMIHFVRIVSVSSPTYKPVLAP